LGWVVGGRWEDQAWFVGEGRVGMGRVVGGGWVGAGGPGTARRYGAG
jgi:hypothetical protein